MDKKNIYSAARFDRFEKAESERVHQISKTHKNSTPPTYIVSVRPDGQINLFNIWPITTTQICRMAIFYPNKFKISPKYSVTLNVFSKTFLPKCLNFPNSGIWSHCLRLIAKQSVVCRGKVKQYLN